jgi:hypothetical protein
LCFKQVVVDNIALDRSKWALRDMRSLEEMEGMESYEGLRLATLVMDGQGNVVYLPPVMPAKLHGAKKRTLLKHVFREFRY